METQTSIRKAIFHGTAASHILLFCYAATSKIIDFDNFQIQLAQSPMLSGFAREISFAVPIAEYIIAALLIFPRYRYAAMHLSFALMMVFTAYIYIILNHSPYVPCSCGGVLDKLGWSEHFIFNCVFAAMGAVAIIIYPDKVVPPANLRES